MRKTYKSFDTFKSEIKGNYSFAVLSKMPFSYILEREKQLFNDPDFKRLKRYEREYLRGISDMGLHSMYPHLQWAFIYNGQYCEKLPYGDDFRQDLVNDSFHHYKGFPDRRF